jgi:hypothetical protein
MRAHELTREWYAELVKVYTAAASEGRPPAKAVQRHFGIPAATAGRRIAEARTSGCLADDVEVRNAKAVAVAKALGVSYGELVRAVREHAGGDLRVAPDDKGRSTPFVSVTCDTGVTTQ